VDEQPEPRPAPAGSHPTGTARDVVPGPVQLAGWIAALQGGAGVVVAIVLAVRAATGHHESTVTISGYGTAVWFAILGGALLAAGVGLLRGRRWGRGLVVLAEVLLLAVAWYLGSGSGRPLEAVALAAVCLVALVSLFRRTAVLWYTA